MALTTAGYFSIASHGFWEHDPDSDPVAVTIPRYPRVAFAAKSGTPPSVGRRDGRGVLLGTSDWFRLFTRGFWVTAPAVSALSSAVVPGRQAGPGSLAYCAKESAPNAPTVPVGWPPGLPFPGPPWPPDWDPLEDIGFYFVGIADGGAIPTGWDKMDGAGSTSDLTGTYIRGATAANLAEQGTRSHTHTTWNGATADAGPSGSHTVTGPSGQVESGPNPVDLWYHAPTDSPLHQHAVTFKPAGDPVAHLPSSRVIDWVGRLLTVSELARYPVGTILGFLGPAARIPSGWTRHTGLTSRFAIGGTAAGTTGADTHPHTLSGTLSTAGNHTHTVASNTGTTVSAAVIAGVWAELTTAPTINTTGAHGHAYSTTSNAGGNVPPYRELIYIIKTGAAGSGAIASNLHVFFDPAVATPATWTDVTSTFNGKLLVGRKVGDADFGSYGNMGSAYNRHSVEATSASGGGHAHTTSAAVAGTGVSGVGTTVRGGLHAHVLSTDPDHLHASGNSNSNSVSNTPASDKVKVMKKT